MILGTNFPFQQMRRHELKKVKKLLKVKHQGQNPRDVYSDSKIHANSKSTECLHVFKGSSHSSDSYLVPTKNMTYSSSSYPLRPCHF